MAIRAPSEAQVNGLISLNANLKRLDKELTEFEQGFANKAEQFFQKAITAIQEYFNSQNVREVRTYLKHQGDNLESLVPLCQRELQRQYVPTIASLFKVTTLNAQKGKAGFEATLDRFINENQQMILFFGLDPAHLDLGVLATKCQEIYAPKYEQWHLTQAANAVERFVGQFVTPGEKLSQVKGRLILASMIYHFDGKPANPNNTLDKIKFLLANQSNDKQKVAEFAGALGYELHFKDQQPELMPKKPQKPTDAQFQEVIDLYNRVDAIEKDKKIIDQLHVKASGIFQEATQSLSSHLNSPQQNDIAAFLRQSKLEELHAIASLVQRRASSAAAPAAPVAAPSAMAPSAVAPSAVAPSAAAAPQPQPKNDEFEGYHPPIRLIEFVHGLYKRSRNKDISDAIKQWASEAVPSKMIRFFKFDPANFNLRELHTACAAHFEMRLRQWKESHTEDLALAREVAYFLYGDDANAVEEELGALISDLMAYHFDKTLPTDINLMMEPLADKEFDKAKITKLGKLLGYHVVVTGNGELDIRPFLIKA